MTSFKPRIEPQTIQSLLDETFHRPFHDLALLEGGQMAQTYSFSVAEKEYILRFCTSSLDATYAKEAFIYRNFAAPDIPIPAILSTGERDGLLFAISEKLPGHGLEPVSLEEYLQTIPSLLDTLFAIHQSDLKKWHGFGTIGDDGNGLFPSWKAYIAHIMEEERADGFYGQWHTLFDTTFLDCSLFETGYAQLMRLLEYCPEERCLVQDGQVTAVLDWIDASYGDFVYDLAGMDFWMPPALDLVGRFRDYYTDNGVSLPHYLERVTCYKLYLALDGLRYWAKTDNRQAYEATCAKLQGFLAFSPTGCEE